MEQAERVAAIDVGSNAIRLVVARIFREGPRPFIKREASYRIPLRLGEDVFSTGEISPRKQEKLVEVFKSFRHLVNFFEPRALRACATSAMREARNGEACASLVREKTGIPLEVISGGEEASLLFNNHLEEDGLLDLNRTYLFIDVGGGSTELTLMVLGKALVSESFRIGTVRTLQNKVDPAEWERMRAWIQALPKHLDPAEAIGSGGNIGKIFDLLDHQGDKQALTRKAIRELIEKLEVLSYAERMQRYNLKPDRADVIVPAGRIFLQVMHWAATKTIYVPKVGIADGVVHSLFLQTP